MKKRVLMVVFEFPPSNGASIQRILSVYKQFLLEGWAVDILTADPIAYSNCQEATLSQLPENPSGKIVRSLALDVLKHLSIKGKHFGWMAEPDRWGFTWGKTAVIAGKKHVKHNRPDLIWSSAPIPTVHDIARKLVKYTGAKWIADYRDPASYLHGGESGNGRADSLRIDMSVIRDADKISFATRRIMEVYTEFHGDCIAYKGFVMENGYDANLLKKMKEQSRPVDSIFSKDRLSLYYAGVLYEDGRDPNAVFEAISRVNLESDVKVELIFQGAGNGEQYREKIKNLGIDGFVSFIEGVPFADAMKNMLSADALLLIQDAVFNNQVPGKVYEYLATERPVLLKSPGTSATSEVALEHEGVWQGVDADTLASNILQLIENKKLLSDGDLLYYGRNVEKYSRQHHADILMKIADMVVG